MKMFLMCILGMVISVDVSAQTLREKFREKFKERMIEREKAKPAPEASHKIEHKITTPGEYIFSFDHKGINRIYKVHVPKKYNFDTPGMLLLALHGGGGDLWHQSNDNYYKQISKSEAEGYIVAFPNGFSNFKTGKFATWNAGKCCAASRDKNSDDVGFIREMIQNIIKQINIDKNRIFTSGMSNGAMMSYRLACEMSDVFKGIAAVAGTDNTIDCTPKNPISILHIHAKNDDHVLFNGGIGSEAQDKSQVTNFDSVASTISKWVKLNGCDEKPKKVLEKVGAYCDLYSGCKNNVEVKLCVTEDGGHSWPGGEKFRKRKGEENSKAISANDVMWDFFNRR